MEEPKSHSIKKQNSKRIIWSNDDFLLLDLHRGFKCSVKVACLNTFVLRIIIQFQHGFRTIDAEQDNISFGLVHLVYITPSNRVLLTVVKYSLRYPAIPHPLHHQFCSNHRKMAYLRLVNCVRKSKFNNDLSRVVSQTTCDSDATVTRAFESTGSTAT